MTFLSGFFFFHIEIFHLCCNFSTVHFGLHFFSIRISIELQAFPSYSKSNNWIMLQTCSFSSIWQKNYDKAKAIWIPCYCTPNYFASRERSSKAVQTRTIFFLQFMKLLRSFVQCSVSVFSDKIIKYDDAHMNFKSSFKALMEHFSLKRLCASNVKG